MDKASQINRFIRKILSDQMERSEPLAEEVLRYYPEMNKAELLMFFNCFPIEVTEESAKGIKRFFEATDAIKETPNEQ